MTPGDEEQWTLSVQHTEADIDRYVEVFSARSAPRWPQPADQGRASSRWKPWPRRRPGFGAGPRSGNPTSARWWPGPPPPRTNFWRGHLGEARHAWAGVVRTLARFEPVLLVTEPGQEGEAAGLVGDTVHPVDIESWPIDDSWARDSGPVVVRAPDGSRVGVHFEFNAWGAKQSPYDADAAFGSRVLDHLGISCRRAPLVLEGGSVVGDGAGTVVTTERCLLHPNRNPSLDRADLEEALARWLGVHRVVWLPDALTDDWGTDGHVDNAVAFVASDRVLLQGCDDPDDPDHAVAATNRRLLGEAGLEVVELEVLPRVACFDEVVEVPYVNLAIVEGGVVVPVTGHPADGDALAAIGACFPDREVVGVPAAVLAYGGGGVHCITQQIPVADGAVQEVSP